MVEIISTSKYVPGSPILTLTDTRRELERFLREDIGRRDITSAILGSKKIKARIVSRQRAVVAGVKYAKDIFVAGRCHVRVQKKDGVQIKRGDIIMTVAGSAYTILSRERTALNLMSRMSGIATATSNMRRLAGGTAIYATRKTAPGLRFFDKRAVAIGGGREHRMKLDESVLIKDNHIAAAGSLRQLISKAKRRHDNIEVEVDSIADALVAASAGASTIMLDNFTPEMIVKTVSRLKEQGLRDSVTLEASGRITPENIKRYAKTGVDMISSGYLTSSVLAVDFSLEL